jgi:hypothetical protein
VLFSPHHGATTPLVGSSPCVCRPTSSDAGSAHRAPAGGPLGFALVDGRCHASETPVETRTAARHSATATRTPAPGSGQARTG